MNNDRQDYLRRQVKELQVFSGMTLKEISELLEIKQCSFYKFMYGAYSLGAEKERKLNEIYQDLI